MLCVWHVRKAWKENVVQKIKNESLRVSVLKAVEEIMYSTDLIQGDVAVLEQSKRLLDYVRGFQVQEGLLVTLKRRGVGRLLCGLRRTKISLIAAMTLMMR
jgi:hypothetical protein